MSNRIRDYSRAERVADGIIHVVGISASLIAVSFLLIIALPRMDAASGAALTIYGIAIVSLFTVSAAYHMTPRMHWRPFLKRCDQAAIFLKIAGTYTPLVILIGSLFGYVVLAFVWLAALMGAFAKLALGERYERISVALYLPMGWASILLIWPIFTTLPPSAGWLIVAGGVLYTVGVIFHVWEKLKYQNAIWHAFVLAASSCHFAAVARASMAAIA